MARPREILLTLIAAAAFVAGISPLQAQDSKSKITKGSGKYEEHYELLPPEGDSGAPAPAGSANLDFVVRASHVPAPGFKAAVRWRKAWRSCRTFGTTGGFQSCEPKTLHGI